MMRSLIHSLGPPAAPKQCRTALGPVAAVRGSASLTEAGEAGLNHTRRHPTLFLASGSGAVGARPAGTMGHCSTTEVLFAFASDAAPLVSITAADGARATDSLDAGGSTALAPPCAAYPLLGDRPCLSCTASASHAR